MKQVLGKKKWALCESISGKKYLSCYTSAKYGHFIAECWFDSRNADWVNYRVMHHWPSIRDGQRVINEFSPFTNQEIIKKDE